MEVDGFQLEIASETDRGDKELTALRGIAKKIQQRYNDHERLLGLLREIHNEIGHRCDEDNEGNPFDLASGSTMADLDNCDIMLRIRKEIYP